MELINRNAMKLDTPFFLISEEKLIENISAFQNALDYHWPNSQLSYSVKTNSLPWLLKYLYKKRVFAEVVSDEEYELAKMCGYSDKEVVFNGPIKGEECFRNALINGSIVNIDSKKELEYLSNTNINNCENLGIRVNLSPDIFEPDDIGYADQGFRFGFSDSNGDFLDALKIVQSKSRRIGLHLHCNSITRSKSVYIASAKYAVSLIKKYGFDVSYIDIGGGFFGGIPGKTTAYEYIECIKNELSAVVNPNKTKLIIEPGSAIIGSVVDFHSSVLDTKSTAKSIIVTTDASRINIDPLWAKNRYSFSTNIVDNRNLCKEQVVCGYTCMDHDRIMILNDYNELKIGDKIVYHRVGAYSMTFGGPFIKYLPSVYVEKNNEYILIRKKMTVNEYYNIQSVR